MHLIGRKKEQALLIRARQSKSAELIALYGRRRIGKTFLIRKTFASHTPFFELTGENGAPLKIQLKNFVASFIKTFRGKWPPPTPKNWREALAILTEQAEENPSKKHLFFFDELPWLAKKKSGFLQALDHFWNTEWSRMDNVKVILCGSAASWMLEHLIYAKGGLHNRITRTLFLEPFDLQETKEFLHAKKIRLNEKHILDLYMVMGGIPYYLNFVEKGKSAEQNIQEICFSKNGPLFTEFERLFRSLFDASELHLKIVRAIAHKKEGISREELLKTLKLSSGGTFNKRIQELRAAGFIFGFIPYKHKKKERYFRLIDEYCSFYLHWIDPIVEKGFIQPNYWELCQQKPRWFSWAGLSFETICFKHIAQIQKALNLHKIPCEVSNWRFAPKKGEKAQGAQIDLLFDRQDGAITLLEMKYSTKPYAVNKALAIDLERKMASFQERTKTKKQLFYALVSPFGLKKSLWSEELISQEVTLKELFSF